MIVRLSVFFLQKQPLAGRAAQNNQNTRLLVLQFRAPGPNQWFVTKWTAPGQNLRKSSGGSAGSRLFGKTTQVFIFLAKIGKIDFGRRWLKFAPRRAWTGSLLRFWPAAHLGLLDTIIRLSAFVCFLYFVLSSF